MQCICFKVFFLALQLHLMNLRIMTMGMNKVMQHFNNKVLKSLTTLAIVLSASVAYSAIPQNILLESAHTENTKTEACTDCLLNGASVGFGPLGRAAGLIAQMIPATVFLNEDGSDPRELIRVPEDLSGIGRIKIAFTDSKGEKREEISGTSFMINECLAVTNRHVIDNAYIDRHAKSDLGFIFEGGTNFDYRSIGKVVAKGEGYNPENIQTDAADWAIIKLEKNLGDEENIGYLKVAFLNEQEIKNRGAMTAGIYKDDLNTIKAHVGCGSGDYSKLGQIRTPIISTNCSSLPGSSGSPIIALYNDDLVVIGIMKNGKDTFEKLSNTKYANEFVPFIKNNQAFDVLTEERLAQIISQNSCN